MKIRIGFVAPSTAWGQLCGQEGIPYAEVNPLSQAVAEECSILVVNRKLTLGEKSGVEDYVQHGGGVVGYTEHLEGVAGIDGAGQDLAYIVGEDGDIFPSVEMLDLGVHGSIPRGANALRTDTNTMAVRAGALGAGFGVVLPFDMDGVFHDTRIVNKSFYSSVDRLPSERVSLVARGELRQLVHGVFEFLHRVRGIPYAHLWYFPNTSRNVFAFRIDSDGASREDVDSLYRIGREHHVPMTWFLDVKSHEAWLEHLRFFVDQEIGLHCYEHRAYSTLEGNLGNITKGLQEMRRAGLNPSGFAAPFGIWNAELGKAIDQCGFEYSSEFSFAYDTLPLFPEVGGMRFTTLQVPVHPICIGSLMKAGYSDVRMSGYFGLVARRKLSRREPLFFYHHPSHRHWNVVQEILGLAGEEVERMTLGAYARWWKRRQSLRYTVDSRGGVMHIHHGDAPVPEDVWLRVAHSTGGEIIVPLQESIDLRSGLPWVEVERPAPPPADIRRIREFDARKMVGELYDSLVRKLR